MDQNPAVSGNGKTLLFLLLYIVLLISIPTASFLLKDQIKQKLQPGSDSSAASQVIRQGTMNEIYTKSFPELFYADLEYNPKTGIVEQIQTGTTNGDFPGLLSVEPAGADKFIYEVEVISKDQEILLSGWGFEYKEIAQDQSGKLKFRVTTSYYPDARVRVLLNQKAIWNGLMSTASKQVS